MIWIACQIVLGYFTYKGYGNVHLYFCFCIGITRYHDSQSNTNHFLIVLYFHLFLSNNYMVQITYFRFIIIIPIMSRYQHVYSWPSLATPPYRPLFLAGPQGYIQYRHRAAVCRFELDVLPLLVYVKGPTGVHPLWVHPYFPSSVLHVWFV